MKRKRFLSSFMAAVLTISGLWSFHAPTAVYAEESVQQENILLNKTAIASSTTNDCGPNLVVDGVTTSSTGKEQWNSADLKDWGRAADNSKDETEQTAQWVQIDRGENATEEAISSIKLWYNAKVWPMEYEIYTADESDLTSGASLSEEELNDWTKIVSVSRPSSFSLVTNGTGQDIADTNANTDTITDGTTPSFTKDAKAKRYVLLYIKKVNAQAPGNNVNIREMEIYTERTSDTPVVADVNTVLNGITAESMSINEDRQIVIDIGDAYGVKAYVRGSELEQVVSNDGVVSDSNIGDRTVALLIRVENVENPDTYAEKNVTVVISDHKDHYPNGYFPTVSVQNEKPEVIPSLQEWYGYTGEFTLTEESKIIYKDTDQLGLFAVAENMQADLQEISDLKLEIVDATKTDVEPTAHDIYIESQSKDTYDVGDEGYVLKVDEEGAKIFAPTYIGCLYGTITIEQILYQADDHKTVPMGITRDYPAYEVRGLMLDVARTPYRLSQLQDYAKIMLWYKMNEYHLHINDCDNCNTNISGTDYSKYAGFHRLESDVFPSLVSEVKQAGIPSDLVNADYYLENDDYQGNPTYTKEEWIKLRSLCSGLGINMMTEIDLPGHSLLYNKYADENPDGITELAGGIAYTSNNLSTKGGLELLDLVGENSSRALWFAKTLWNEYTAGDTPVIDGDVVHIGADEYWDHSTAGIKDAFAEFADEIRQTIQGNLGSDTKIRMWGAGTGMFSTASSVLSDVDLPENYQLDFWSTGYENARARSAEGFQIVNCRDAYTYGNPGRTKRDVPNAEMLFDEWDPTIFGANNLLLGDPNLLGAKTVIWGDQSQEGMIEQDVHQRVLRAVAIMSEKTWGATTDTDTFEEYELRAARLEEGPGTSIAMDVKSASSLVLDYDFTNLSADKKTVYDISGNGYDGVLSSAAIVSEDGYLTFDGTAMTTPLKTVSYPYSVAFTLKVSPEEGAKNTTASSIFSGYDGQLQIAGTKDGHLSGNVNYFTRDFDYTVPTDGTEVQIMLVGTFQGTKLYVDGELVTFLSQKADADGLGTGAIASLYSSFVLPLEKIGEGLHAQMKDLQVYNRALSAEEAAMYYTDAWYSAQTEVNVAQNAAAGSTARPSGEGPDTTERRINVAFKAVDGDAFVEKTDKTAQPDTATSEINSYWKGSRADSALQLDLGEVRNITKVEIQWRYGGKGKNFDIQVSLDGETWTTAKEVRSNQEFFNTVVLDAPTQARYVRMKGIESNGGSGKVYMIQEFMVYESVDKSDMDTLLSQAGKVIADANLGFDAVKDTEQELVEAMTLASSVRNNKTSTCEDVETATERLTAALQEYEEKEEPIENPFTDVPEDLYCKDAVLWAVAKGITRGTSIPGIFDPKGECTRIQVVTFLWRLAGYPTPAYTDWDITDMNYSGEFDKAAHWAYEQGIMQGYRDGTFRPDEPVTRAQFVTLLYRMAGKPSVSGTCRFPDVNDADHSSYKEAIIWADQTKITTGYSDGNFRPDAASSRGDVLEFMYRAFVKIGCVSLK